MRPHEGPEGAVMCRAQACVPGGLVCADEMQLGGGDRASAQQIPRWFVREFARQASPHKAVGDGTGKVLALHVSGRCALCKLHMKCRAPTPALSGASWLCSPRHLTCMARKPDGPQFETPAARVERNLVLTMQSGPEGTQHGPRPLLQREGLDPGEDLPTNRKRLLHVESRGWQLCWL